ncbi:MAG: ankyrin repeat domain-containing protein [Treponema sp.]|jgi:ankyrin repeat protein|nr:ankyrin repeat domain-containing protein [Treponema sp.]
MKHTNSAYRIFHALLCGLCLAFSLLVSCASPPPPPPPPPPEDIVEDDVWTLLEKGELDAARKFFEGQTRIDSTDLQGRTPLHISTNAGDYTMTAFFVSLGATMDLLDRENRTPLSVAVERGDARSARMLIEAGADIHRRQSGRQTPAVASIAMGGDFLRTVLTPTALQSVDAEGRTMLHLAAIAGNAEAVEIIIDEEEKLRDNNLKTADKEGKTPLDLALEEVNSKEHFEAAEKLILAGAVSANPIYAYMAPAVRSSNYNTRIGDGIAPLHFAAGEGYSGMAEYLLEKNVDINVKNASGTTPLHEAARSGNLVIMDLLLQRGANVRAQDAKGNTPMHIGIPPASHQAALTMLLLHGADPNIRDEHGESPLHIMISLNRGPEALSALLEGGADVSIRNIEGKTPLYLAAQENRVDSIGVLLKHKSDLFAADNNGVTPFELALRENSPVLLALITEETALQSDSQGNTVLHIAVAAHADTAILEHILDRKALVNARNKAGDTALHFAVRDDLRDTGELLTAQGADVFANNANGESPLYLSFPEKIPPGKVREWIVNPVTILARDGAGNSILHYAAQWKLDTHIPMIVSRGVNPNVPNAMGEPPLFMAVKADSRNTVLALLAAGAHIEARDAQGNNSLHAAVRWNAVNAAQTLISRAANVNAHALNGKTPLHDSIRWGIIRMETLLIGNGANLEVRDNEGNTPFMEAIIAGYIASAERLNEIGADVTIRNNRGDTPLHIAVAQDRLDMVVLLLGWGAKIHARNIMEKTPFQIALATSPRIVSALLTPEWIGVPDDNGRSPLHIAILANADVETVKTIIDMGAKVSSVDLDGKTPLHLALERNKWGQAKVLADSGANVFAVAGDGKTPAEIAIAKGREAINAIFSGSAIAAQDPTGNTILHYAARIGGPDLVALLIDLGASKTTRNISAESPGDVALKWRRADIAALLNS